MRRSRRAALALVLAAPLMGAAAARGAGRPAPASPQPIDASWYRLRLTVDPAARRIAGCLTLRATVSAPRADSIRLDFADSMRVDSVRLDGRAAGFAHAGGTLAVAAGLDHGARFALDVWYQGHPADHAFTFADHDGSPRISTYGLPYHGREWWPSHDTPADKADSMDLEVTVPESLTVASNGRLVRREAGPDGLVTWHWSVRYPIYPDVVSLAIARYDTFTLWHRFGADSMPLTFFAFPEDSAKARADFSVLPDILTFYESIFGPYPFRREKYGVAEFTTQSFREHQTLPSYGAALLTGDHRNDGILAHELAHQWFGNALSVTNWSDVWLNESFAQYAALLWREHAGGHAAYAKVIGAMAAASYPGTLVIPDSTNVGAMFGGTTFRRGPLVLHMLRHVMGDRAFLAALRAYVTGFAYRNVTTADFQRVAEAACGRPLGWFFREWVYGAGRPVYALTWTQRRAGGAGFEVDVTLTQTQAGAPFTMPIDVALETARGPVPDVLHDSVAVQHFSLTSPDSVTAVTLDPGGWVIRGTG